jgi:hypothetical protein
VKAKAKKVVPKPIAKQGLVHNTFDKFSLSQVEVVQEPAKVVEPEAQVSLLEEKEVSDEFEDM